MDEKRFNVRVYGILINDRNELLVSDELIKGIRFTKFPGGGLEWGEGIEACLKREFIEDLNQPIKWLTIIIPQTIFKSLLLMRMINYSAFTML